MKTVLFFLLCCIGTVTIAQTAGKKHSRQTILKANITLTNGDRIKGILTDFSDSGIIVSGVADTTNLIQINYRNIKSANIRKAGEVLRGLLLTTLVSIGTGALIGLAQGTDKPGTWFYATGIEKAIAYSLFFEIVTLPVGIIWGALYHNHYRIDGDYSRFEKFREKMSRRLQLHRE